MIRVVLATGEQVCARRGDYVVWIREAGKWRCQQVFRDLQKAKDYADLCRPAEVKIVKL